MLLSFSLLLILFQVVITAIVVASIRSSKRNQVDITNDNKDTRLGVFRFCIIEPHARQKKTIAAFDT